MKFIEEEGEERALKLHKTNCDMLYRWSMWRMYLNEEMSRVISARQDHVDQSKSIYNVTSPYIKHPDGKKYGHQMKNMFCSNSKESHALNILSDNVYLVYGLPRVSLRKRVPDEVHQLHESLHKLELQYKRAKEADGILETDEQISKLFDFVTAEEMRTDSQAIASHTGPKDYHIGGSKPVINGTNLVSSALNTNSVTQNEQKAQDNKRQDVTDNRDKSEETEIKSQKDVPLASKSRLFWERLADKKSKIIEMGKQKPEVKENHEHTVISSEILQKQQKLLKKTTPKRTSKDLWRTLRERKTEILQMREMTSASGQKNQHDNHNSSNEKKHGNKTSQLWGFIFHKKKELVHMKRGRRVSQDVGKVPREINRKKSYSGPSDTNSNISPRNFEDSFQKELAERLRKRRIHLEPEN